MDIANLLFAFEGRISRKQFWLGVVIITAIELVLLWATGVSFSEASLDQHSRIVKGVIGLLTIYPTAAIAVKRLHDRNQPGVYVWLLVAVSFVAAAMDFFGVTEQPQNAGILVWVFSAAVLVIALAFLIELGFRRGTPGDNRFGPDPVAAKT